VYYCDHDAPWSDKLRQSSDDPAGWHEMFNHPKTDHRIKSLDQIRQRGEQIAIMNGHLDAGVIQNPARQRTPTRRVVDARGTPTEHLAKIGQPDRPATANFYDRRSGPKVFNMRYNEVTNVAQNRFDSNAGRKVERCGKRIG